MSSTDETVVDATASAIAGIEELALLDDGTLERIEELETYMLYRQFYFPGAETVKIVPGVGEDVAGVVRYDGITGDRDLFSRWDPRYLDDYIYQSQQNGFYRHFLYYNGSTIVPYSYEDAYDRLSACLSGSYIDTSVAGCTSMDVYGILAGLLWFDKLTDFMSEYKSKLGVSYAEVYSLLTVNGRSVKITADEELVRFIGQTSANFIANDYGYQATSTDYGFDLAQYLEEWNSCQEAYEEYKNKIWEILLSVDALNICTNSVSGVQVGDVSISQMMDCSMTIGDTTSTTTDETTTDGTTTDETPIIETANESPIEETSTESSTEAVIESSPEESLEEVITDSSTNITLVICLVVIIAFIIVGCIGYFIYNIVNGSKNNGVCDSPETINEPTEEYPDD